MVRTIEEGDLEGRNLVSGEHTVGHRGFKAFLDTRDILFRNVSALDLIVELEAGDAFVGRRDLYDDVSKFTPSARLLLEDLAMLDGRRDGLLVIDVRSALVDVDAELAAETVHDDVEVEFAHSADDGLAGLFVRLHGEGRVLLGELAECDSEFVEVLLGLRLDGETDDRIREFH